MTTYRRSAAQAREASDTVMTPHWVFEKRIHDRETPWPGDWLGDTFDQADDGKYNTRMVHRVHVPESELQALMEAPPFEEPARAQPHYDALHEVLGVALDSLEGDELLVAEMMLCQGLSTRECAAELGRSKSVIDRLKQSALRRLRVLLESDDLVKEHFGWQ